MTRKHNCLIGVLSSIFLVKLASSNDSCFIESNTDYNNGYLLYLSNCSSASDCCGACSEFEECGAFSYVHNLPTVDASDRRRCFLKAFRSGNRSSAVVSSGVVVSSPATTSQPPSTTSASSGRRAFSRGIGWVNMLCSDLKRLKSVAWIYNWMPYPLDDLSKCLSDTGIEFVPMQWGPGDIDILNTSIHWTKGGSILGFNEPNFIQQANISPEDAAAQWPQIEAVADRYDLRIGSPAPSPGGQLMTYQDWYDWFFGNCTGCRVDFLAFHLYESDIEDIDQVRKYNLPIWLTEYGRPAYGQNDSAVVQFMQDSLLMLDNDPQIERYAWFGTRVDPDEGWLGPANNIFAGDGASLTRIGQLYNGPVVKNSTAASTQSYATTGALPGPQPTTSPRSGSPADLSPAKRFSSSSPWMTALTVLVAIVLVEMWTFT